MLVKRTQAGLALLGGDERLDAEGEQREGGFDASLARKRQHGSGGIAAARLRVVRGLALDDAGHDRLGVWSGFV